MITDASIGRGLPQFAVQVCTASVPTTVTTAVPMEGARRSRQPPPFFRRALKIVNGGSGQTSERADHRR